MLITYGASIGAHLVHSANYQHPIPSLVTPPKMDLLAILEVMAQFTKVTALVDDDGAQLSIHLASLLIKVF